MRTNNLKRIRTRKNLSQLQLSANTRISPGIISNIENEKIFAYPGWRKRLAEALNVHESEIWPDDVGKGGKNNGQQDVTLAGSR